MTTVRFHAERCVSEDGARSKARTPERDNCPTRGGFTMASLKRWRQIGQGQFHKWETPGDALEGAWQGSREGRYGPLGAVETTAGLLTFPLHAALVQRLQHVRIGADVLIRYTGPQTSKAGRL